MSVDSVFTGLHVVSMFGMAYVGFQHGRYVKRLINHPVIEPYKRKFIVFDKHKFVNEDMFCNMVGCFTGVMIGRFLWPVCIPISAWYMEKRHGDDIRKMMKGL